MRPVYLVRPGIWNNTTGVSEIDWSKTGLETAFGWRHNGSATSQLSDLIKWTIHPKYLVEIFEHVCVCLCVFVSVFVSVCEKDSITPKCRRSTPHYGDVIMNTIASQITSLAIVFSTVYLDIDQRKHQSSASLAFVWGIHRGPVNSPHKWSVTRKMFPFDDVIMCTLVFDKFQYWCDWNLGGWHTSYFFTTNNLPLCRHKCTRTARHLLIWMRTETNGHVLVSRCFRSKYAFYHRTRKRIYYVVTV